MKTFVDANVDKIGFPELSGKYGPKMLDFLLTFTSSDRNSLFLKAKAEWDNPGLKKALKEASGKEDVSEKFRAISLQARLEGLDRAIDKAVFLTTGLARVDIVLVEKNGQAFSLETGWNFKKGQVSIEGIRRYKSGERKGKPLAPEEAAITLKNWLDK